MGYDAIVRIDLHLHSTASDGTFTPLQLIRRAEQLGLGAIAITDHDAIEGCREAFRHAPLPRLKLLSGVEISTEPPALLPHKGSLHILGYGFRLEDAALNTALSTLQEARKNRNPEILSRLKKIGIHLSMEEVRLETGDGQLGRPHIARLMVAKGIVATIDEAFDRYLGKGKPGYVDKYRIPCADAIRIIRDAGGIAVLAHPGLLKTEPAGNEMEILIDQLTAWGLEGLEVYYPAHSPMHTDTFIALAERHGLLLTGGSDFHGALQDDIDMGTGDGTLNVPFELYEKLMNAIASIRRTRPNGGV
ncbi:MAG: PHP domain-containing protein [Thermodesulfobacteriota bacterium]